MVSVNLLFYCLTFCGAAGASSLMCVNLFSQNRTITLAEIKNAMSEIDSNLQKPSNEYEIDFRDAYNAFFTPDIGFEGKKTWRGQARKIKLTQEELDKSWLEPVDLAPTEMTLYKGVLFPNAIYVRRVSNGGLNRAYPYGFENYGKEMPYAVLHGDHVEIHKNNGGQKIFELWLKDNLSKDGLVTLYRSGLDLEYELQALIFKMKKLDLKKAADASEVSHLQKISQKLSERGYEDLHRNLDYVLKKIGNISRGQLISDLLQELGGISGGIFTTPSSKAVQSFPDEGNLIMVYKFPVDKLIQMFSLNQIYVGIEFGYIEIAFIDSVENQQSKSILIDSLTGTLKK